MKLQQTEQNHITNSLIYNKQKFSSNLKLLAKACYNYCNKLIDRDVVYMHIKIGNLTRDTLPPDEIFHFLTSLL